MARKAMREPGDDLPKGIGAPATRALNGAGFTTLAQLTRLTQEELLALHGVGPKALALIIAALQERGLSLAESQADSTGQK